MLTGIRQAFYRQTAGENTLCSLQPQHLQKMETTNLEYSELVMCYGLAKPAMKVYDQAAELVMCYGLAKPAMKVYDQAAEVLPAEKLTMYNFTQLVWLRMLGIPKTREICGGGFVLLARSYRSQQAIQPELLDQDVKSMCMKYADLEKSWEKYMDNARAEYILASKFADPRSDADLWSK